MFNRNENIDASDMYRCPLTLEIIRHPVFASDGRRYEARDLSEWVRRGNVISPVSKQPLTSITYDHALKNELDTIYSEDRSEDRHEDYEIDDYLPDLMARINTLYSPRKKAAYKAVINAQLLLTFYIFFSTTVFDKEELDASSVLLSLLICSMTDFVLSMTKQEQCRFFHLVSEKVSTCLGSEPEPQARADLRR